MAQIRENTPVRGKRARRGSLPEGAVIVVYASILLLAAMFSPTGDEQRPPDIPEPDLVPMPQWPEDIDVPITAARWTAILVHHTATEQNTPEEIDRYHHDVLKWANGLGYHFVICNGSRGTVDGQIYVGDRWKRQIDGAHCAVKGSPINWNHLGIGVCLVGDFTRHGPTRAQMASLIELVDYLRQRWGIPLSRIHGHGHVKKNTECPGAKFPWNELMRGLGAERRD